VIAATVALVLALASPGAARARTPAGAPESNAARARRGLLPRKLAKRPSSHARRVVLLPPAPTWLGEPGGVADPLVVLAEAGEPGSDGAARARLAPMAAADAPEEAAAATGPWASAEGTEVRAVIVRRAPEGSAALRAGVAGAQVQAVIRRTAPER
jgi:hypothetical protein